VRVEILDAKRGEESLQWEESKDAGRNMK